MVAEHGAQSRMSFQRVMFSQKACLLLVLIASVWRAETCGPRLILQASLQWLIEHDVQVRLSHCLSGSLSCLLLVLIASVWRAETCGPRLILQASLQWLIEHDVQVRLSHCLSGSLY